MASKRGYCQFNLSNNFENYQTNQLTTKQKFSFKPISNFPIDSAKNICYAINTRY